MEHRKSVSTGKHFLIDNHSPKQILFSRSGSSVILGFKSSAQGFWGMLQPETTGIQALFLPAQKSDGAKLCIATRQLGLCRSGFHAVFSHNAAPSSPAGWSSAA
jgi:hypothetical protein